MLGVAAGGILVALGASGQGLFTVPAYLSEDHAGLLRIMGTASVILALVALAWIRGRVRSAPTTSAAGATSAAASTPGGPGETDRPSGDGVGGPNTQLNTDLAVSDGREPGLQDHFATAAKVMVVLAVVALLTPPPTSDPRTGDDVAVQAVANPDMPPSDEVPAPPPLPPDDEPQSGGLPDSEASDPPPFESGALERFAGDGSRLLEGAEAEADAGPTLPEWTSQLLTFLLVAGGVGLLVYMVLARMGREKGEAGEDDEELEDDPFLVPSYRAHAALRAPEDGRGPAWGPARGRVGQAYQTLLEALAEAGVPRRRVEGPHEHLNRAVSRLGVEADPLHRLGRLHVAAEFGSAPTTDHDGDRADAALAESLEVLHEA